jgi:hypothetical protein
MRSLFDVANQRYDDLKRIKTAIEDGSFVGRILGGDAEMRAIASRLKYTTAAEYGQVGHGLSDKDVSMMSSINLGYDPTGNVIDQARFAQNTPEILKMIDTELRSMPDKVSKQASTFLDTNLVGDKARILYTPQQVTKEAPEAQNATQVFQGAGLSQAPAAPADVSDFERRKALEAEPMFKGRELPAYDQGKVAEFATSAQGLSPEYIRKLAENTLKDLSDNKDPWAGKVDQGALTTRLAIESARDKAVKEAEAKVKALRSASDTLGFMEGLRGMPKPTTQDIAGMATRDVGLTDAPDAVEAALKAAEAAYERGRKAGGRDTLDKVPVFGK